MTVITKGIQIDGFVLEKKLGAGSYGEAWLVVKNEQEQVMKLFYDFVRADDLQEYNILRQLEHPNIVNELGRGQFGNRFYVILEYVKGSILTANNIESFSKKQLLQIVSQFAAGLDYAHKTGLVHRDIKPSNVMLSTSGEVKILDFGSASKITYNPLYKSIEGSYAFMSPEQLTGRISTQADIWAFGVTLYKWCTNNLPFEAKEIKDLYREVLIKKPVPPHQVNPGIPLELSLMIIKCLEKKPADRYQNFEEILSELEPGRQAQKVMSEQQAMKEWKKLERLVGKSWRLSLNRMLDSTDKHPGAGAWGCLGIMFLLACVFVLYRMSWIVKVLVWGGLIYLIYRYYTKRFRRRKQVRSIPVRKILNAFPGNKRNEMLTGLLEAQEKNQGYAPAIPRIDQIYFYNEIGQIEKARKEAEFMLRGFGDPYNMELLTFLMNSYYQSGEEELAGKYCQKLLLIDPAYAPAVLMKDLMKKSFIEKEGFSGELKKTLVRKESKGIASTDSRNKILQQILKNGSVAIPTGMAEKGGLEVALGSDYFGFIKNVLNRFPNHKNNNANQSKKDSKTMLRQGYLILYHDFMQVKGVVKYKQGMGAYLQSMMEGLAVSPTDSKNKVGLGFIAKIIKSLREPLMPGSSSLTIPYSQLRGISLGGKILDLEGGRIILTPAFNQLISPEDLNDFFDQIKERFEISEGVKPSKLNSGLRNQYGYYPNENDRTKTARSRLAYIACKDICSQWTAPAANLSQSASLSTDPFVFDFNKRIISLKNTSIPFDSVQAIHIHDIRVSKFFFNPIMIGYILVAQLLKKIVGRGQKNQMTSSVFPEFLKKRIESVFGMQSIEESLARLELIHDGVREDVALHNTDFRQYLPVLLRLFESKILVH